MNLLPGDIVEVVFDDGWGYVKVFQQHPVYQEVLALDPQRYEHPVAAIETLSFDVIVMFPLTGAIRNGRVKTGRVLHGPLPTDERQRFKIAVRDRTGKIIYWWIWNGDQVSIPSPEVDLTQLPERRVLSLDGFRLQFRERANG